MKVHFATLLALYRMHRGMGFDRVESARWAVSVFRNTRADAR